MIFYLLLIGIILLPTLMILPALTNRRGIVETNRDAENVNIARQRLREIAKLENAAAINFQEAEIELQATLLEDLHKDKTTTSATSTVPFKSWGLLIIVLIPLLSLILYHHLGNPELARQAIDGTASVKQQQAQTPDSQFDIEQLLLLLEEKLVEDSANPQGWELAGKTYMNLGNFKQAESAYAKLNALVVGNPDFLVAWADAEIMANGNVYTPAAEGRVEQALSINPNHINGLWIAGLGAKSLGYHVKALRYLNTLLPLIAKDKTSSAKIKLLIAQIMANTDDNLDVVNVLAKKQKHISGNHDSGKVISVEVTLANNLIAKVDKEDVVFVFAKALKGVTAPLAVSTHRVKELPIKIELTEDMAMLPNMNIALFDKITVVARISKTANALQQSGDLVSNTVLISEENQGNSAKLKIDQIVE